MCLEVVLCLTETMYLWYLRFTVSVTFCRDSFEGTEGIPDILLVHLRLLVCCFHTDKSEKTVWNLGLGKIGLLCLCVWWFFKRFIKIEVMHWNY